MKNELSIKYYQKLLTGKGRKENGVFTVEGVRQVKQFALSNKTKILEILTVEPLDFETNISVRIINYEQLCKITDSKNPGGVIAVVEFPKIKNIDEITGNVLLLENIQDPGNVGNLIRSAAAFGFSSVILSQGCADVYSPKVVRSTGGAICNLDIIFKKDIFECINTLKNLNYRLVAADLDGKSEISSLKNEKIILALGNEGNGISDKLKLATDFFFTIPYNKNAVESLNVSTAGSIGMYIFTKQI
ncbi:MAG: RNA methyltransferase [Chitinispirillales bacterium]|jgi:TrmH family RNA methyltransferase|nr:RNA methyltransferase [Chitinispirillales bacterium]